MSKKIKEPNDGRPMLREFPTCSGALGRGTDARRGTYSSPRYYRLRGILPVSSAIVRLRERWPRVYEQPARYHDW